MIPHILEVAESGRYISKQHGAIIIKDGTGPGGMVPLDDIGIMIVSAYGATLTKEALVSLAERGAVTVLCGTNCLPAALVVPTTANYEMPLRVRLQVGATLPLKKRLWQALVQAKLVHQGRVLESIGKNQEAHRIFRLSTEVQSGDPQNKEATGARVYWKNLFGETFHRSKDGTWPNGALNYGYTILRSATARAIYGAGLLPLFSIHHENSTNTLPLADDLMEPYRPIVDYIVYNVAKEEQNLTSNAKQLISKLIWADLTYKESTTPLHKALEQLCYSLVQSFNEKKCVLEIPEIRVFHELS
jgi:CRISPR-associated protein Cas1